LVSSYAKKWNLKFNSNEKLFSMPLVYTPSGSTTELVIIGSIQNTVRVVNSSSGAIIATKQLDVAYLSSDSNCNDGATVGITGTPYVWRRNPLIFLDGFSNVWRCCLPELQFWLNNF
jgi:hypothetical protein